MDDQLKHILDKHRVLLVEDLEVDEHFLAYFVTDGIFTVDRIDEIKAKSTRAEQAAAFLNILRRRGPKAKQTFINALESTGQEHIAEQVKAALEAPTRSTVNAQESTRVEEPKPNHNAEATMESPNESAVPGEDAKKPSRQYHVCITSVDEDAAIKAKVREELEKRDIRCYDSKLGNMDTAAKCCVKKLLLISKAWGHNDDSAAERSVMHIREHCERGGGNEQISMVYVAIDDVTMDDIAEDLRHEIETTGQVLLQYKESNQFWELLVTSIQRTAKVCDDAPCGDVAFGMCGSYFYGYLNIVLNELEKMLEKWLEAATDRAHTRVVKKLFVICPEKHEKGDVVMLDDMAGIKLLNQNRISKLRAGTCRQYDLFMYQLTASNGEEFWVPMVMNWTLVGINSMVGDECFPMTHEQMKFQNLIFLHKLQNVLESKQMHHHVRLIPVKGSMMKDKNDTSLAEKLVEECEEALQPQRCGPGKKIKAKIINIIKSPRKEEPKPNLNEDTNPYININVQEVDVTSKDFKKKLSDQLVYDVKRKIRGHAVIINNEFFENSTNDREGSKYDKVNLEKLFIALGYKTIVHENKTAEEMEQIILRESHDPEHREADSFVLALLSHGAEGIVCGIDDADVSIEDKIKAPFDGKNCPQLAGKPKLILIQACQGDKETEGVAVADAARAAARGRGDVARRDGGVRRDGRVQEKGDMLVAYSTVFDYAAWRQPNEGSWFIRTLVKVFMLHAHTDHVVELLTRVRREVSQRQTSLQAGGLYVQMTKDDNTLTKKWYLFPGYTPKAAK